MGIRCGIVYFLVSTLVPLFPAVSEVYLTKDQALSLVLGAEAQHIYDPKAISTPLLTALKKTGLIKEARERFHFFKGEENGRVSGYALIDTEVGKHLPITYIVGITPTGEVSRVEMMVFREVRGWEARERRFMQQFESKKMNDELTIGRTIRHVTGATLSSRAIAKGVKRALFLWRHFYGGEAK